MQNLKENRCVNQVNNHIIGYGDHLSTTRGENDKLQKFIYEFVMGF